MYINILIILKDGEHQVKSIVVIILSNVFELPGDHI